MIFVSYKPGSKGYQFWDAKNRCFEISCDVKFNESKFPNRKDLSAEDRKIKVKSTASPPSDTESENSDEDLVNPYPFSDGNDSDGHSHHQPKPPTGKKQKPTVETDSDEDDDDDEQHHAPVQPVPPVQEQRGSQRHTEIPTNKGKGKERDPGPSAPEGRFTFQPPTNPPRNQIPEVPIPSHFPNRYQFPQYGTGPPPLTRRQKERGYGQSGGYRPPPFTEQDAKWDTGTYHRHRAEDVTGYEPEHQQCSESPDPLNINPDIKTFETLVQV